MSKAEFPKLSIKQDDEGQIELDVVDNAAESVVFGTDNVPYSVTVCKIGQNYVIDSDFKEEAVTKVKISIGFDQSGNVRFVSKDGFGSLDPDTLYGMIDVFF